MMAKAFICGASSTSLSIDERAFFAAERPWGLILFARNCHEPEQIRDIVAEFRECVADIDAPVLIDQEGGRVRRLRPPMVADYPPGDTYGRIFARDRHAGLRAAWLGARLIGGDLRDLGINVDCLPIVDVRFPDTDDVIGDRAYGDTPDQVAEIGRAIASGLEAAGVLPVLKHIPGHGRATVDSHHELPVVDAAKTDLYNVDFVPFRRLSDLPLAMTAHIVYRALDPQNCATHSSKVIAEIIRGEIGFDGCLMSDDVSMRALGGDMRERVTGLFAAGCDLALHCNGDFAEMRNVAAASPELRGKALVRANAAKARIHAPEPVDRGALREEFERLIGD
ncbi:beta-N-acetylhexosaminidase [Rhizobiales bacterium]|uniref:beta-N-acetylhexosaminidase n=1 Tax=Hongsoonwoonella zoysiae TaxID=2821844 RepID=UPI001560A0E0|nr:beta-N-acetylhexosaminidase [Hongsoonwoonella zoysiae]NRG18872.1 beta-N-acetylhexosaminidase [Hongsoonwoonella zoysiae]